MDVDRFIVIHQGEWHRLEELAARAGKWGEKLEAAEADELVARYQRATLHLSLARTEFRDPGLILRLSTVVSAAHASVHGARVPRLAAVKRFFAWTFPAAAWTCRRQIAWGMVLMFGSAVVLALMFHYAPDRVSLVMPQKIQHEYLDRDFVSYYSDNPSIVFFTKVVTNNVAVAMACFLLGALLAVPGAIFLFQNGGYLGLVAALFWGQGRFVNTFLTYIVPHGLLELTCFSVAAAAGFRVGWAVFSPGDRGRGQAVAAEGQRAVVVLAGVAVGLVGAGTIEGFVTGSALPVAVKLMMGVMAWLAFVSWALVRGRVAVAAGWSGALEELRPRYVQTDPYIAALMPPGPVGYSVDPLEAAAAAARGDT